jgi:hypothetical protein
LFGPRNLLEAGAPPQQKAVGKAVKAPSTLLVTVDTTTSRKIPRAVCASVADVGSDDGAAAAVEIVEVRL